MLCSVHMQRETSLHLYSGKWTGTAVVVRLLAELVENDAGRDWVLDSVSPISAESKSHPHLLHPLLEIFLPQAYQNQI